MKSAIIKWSFCFSSVVKSGIQILKYIFFCLIQINLNLTQKNRKYITIIWTKQKPQSKPFSRLTETARLLRNVRNVFSRRSNTRVNMEIELSREYYIDNNKNKRSAIARKENDLNVHWSLFCSNFFFASSLTWEWFDGEMQFWVERISNLGNCDWT